MLLCMKKEKRMIEIGMTAPDFTLPDQDGRPFSLSSLRGSLAIVYFYPKDNTPGCTKEACGFNSELAELGGLGVHVVGISADSAASHQKFIARYNLAFTLLSDSGHEVMKAYGAYGTKVSYGKETVGVIRTTYLIGRDGRVLRSWQKGIKTADHHEKVLEEVRRIAESGN